MMMRNGELYIRSMGKMLKVEAYFPSTPDGVDSANILMIKHDNLAVVAEVDGLILLADKYDKGLAVAKKGAAAPNEP